MTVCESLASTRIQAFQALYQPVDFTLPAETPLCIVVREWITRHPKQPFYVVDDRGHHCGEITLVDLIEPLFPYRLMHGNSIPFDAAQTSFLTIGTARDIMKTHGRVIRENDTIADMARLATHARSTVFAVLDDSRKLVGCLDLADLLIARMADSPI